MVQLPESDYQFLSEAAIVAGADEVTLQQLRVIATVSPFIAQSLKTLPWLWVQLIPLISKPNHERDLRARFDAWFATRADEEFDRALRQIRRIEMIRIAWRDVCGLADTQETLFDLSQLADQSVQQALLFHEAALTARHGSPRDHSGQMQRLVVLGMGKLGGYELNYSSDIDLIFAFEHEGETDGERPIANSQFFIKLGQRIIRSLDHVTSDGFVFRVDMRLRPHGDEGALALPFDAMEHYYATLGREWERYAFIKARVIAGDFAAGETLLNQLKPFVYRKYLDFGAFAQLRDMKKAIEVEMTRKGLIDNIKLGPGGIREVEFIGQLFQLLRGGREPRLQSRSILKTLDVLGETHQLPASMIAELKSGYDFLRRTENRLQMQHDQQTQSLPIKDDDRTRLALAMGFDSWQHFLPALDAHRHRIHRHFGEILKTQRDERRDDDPLLTVWQDDSLSDARAMNHLEHEGFSDPQAALETLRAWKREHYALVSDIVRQRLDVLIPNLLHEVATGDNAISTLQAVLTLISAVLGRSVYLALLIEQPQALRQLIQLCSASPWISDLLRQHPILLDELVDPEALYVQPDVDDLCAELDGLLSRFPEDEERQFDELRRFRQLSVLRVAAADAMGVLPVMRVSDQLTWIAEVALRAVLNRTRDKLQERYGRPQATTPEGVIEPGFAIIGYGKLGGIELGYGSDLDLVFLHDSDGEETVTTGPQVIDNSLFFARIAQKIIHTLSIRTPAGVLYEIDTRLRPDGVGGLLVSSLKGFAQYQQEHAWLWEIQALCRARFICGHPPIESAFTAIRKAVICTPRDPNMLRSEIRAMREKMRAEQDSPPPDHFHLKRGVGGITDIEFIVQYLLLRHAHAHPEIIRFTDNIRQLTALMNEKVLPEAIGSALITAYQSLRNATHRRTLANQSLNVPIADFASERATVMATWQHYFTD
ncbi:bifunctional glutamine synthetase adenylyltransferase/deadenyltransferase [Halothiobacillus diazotrophicus]|uniref:Bifunctional glutamine synthetase adenylyltransferase/adenylyl-removing enzyme n=1 Tax=Halothiobacillus diazotrophicus TaxID=1860122 RepID=A0A191ZI26_9GAMM|nr:bifunctional [glutamate--ammonia ligase]-adenylyl-L-tyrosine phosphorylase/[glutamate--ammonia-ligase] adenylyltransferase [Halothiobacillus diazotrophicus]ANJ67520.1 bifunctional glutamine synthetase adenylyltransferase/deadenyltransferase [Halothiobacillus diazotrophicus]